MDANALKELIKQELPQLLRTDPALRLHILELTRHEYADRLETQDRFHQLLGELRQDREEQNRKWQAYTEEQNRKWEEQNRKWEEQNRKWDEHNSNLQAYIEEQNRNWWAHTEEQNRKWEEQNSKWEEQNRKWDEQNSKWDEQNRKWHIYNEEQSRKDQEQRIKWDEQHSKWEASEASFQRVHEEIMAQAKKFERTIGALGARWGLQSERSFRNALAGILEISFGVQVLNINEYDDTGTVFGRPDQVELDIIIKNGMLIICELKSSIDKAGMYIFERKARFYETHHQRTADRLIVISPMVDPKAQKVAEKLGIEVYSDSLEVPTSTD